MILADRKEVKVMTQIILYEWKIIFSGSLLHKTPTPCSEHNPLHTTHISRHSDFRSCIPCLFTQHGRLADNKRKKS